MIYAILSFSNLPLKLFLIPSIASIAITPQGPFVPFADVGEMSAFFDHEFFMIEGRKYEYSATYRCKEATTLVEWLKQQSLLWEANAVIFETKREETNDES